MYRNPEKPQQAAEVLRFFDWAYRNGDKMALELDYVPMPDSMVKQIESQWAQLIKDGSGKALWTGK
jgi:phosphate transport system substrate-binding protein